MSKLTPTTQQTMAFLDFFPTEMKMYIHVKTSTQIFIAVVLIMVQNWTFSKKCLMGEWLKNCCTSMHCKTAQKYKEIKC